MPKIGTAVIELKPVLNEEALDQIAERIEAAVKAGVEAGMAAMARPMTINYTAATEPIDYATFARKMHERAVGESPA